MAGFDALEQLKRIALDALHPKRLCALLQNLKPPLVQLVRSYFKQFRGLKRL